MPGFVDRQLASTHLSAAWLAASMVIGLLTGSAGANLARTPDADGGLEEGRRSLLQLAYLADADYVLLPKSAAAETGAVQPPAVQLAARGTGDEPARSEDPQGAATPAEVAALSAELQALMARTQAVLSELQRQRQSGETVVSKASAEQQAQDRPTGQGLEAGRKDDVLVQLADRPEERAELVARVQRQLASLGLDPGPIDGIYGPRTAAAVAAFRERAGLGGGGRITLAMLEALAERRAEEGETAPDPAAAGGDRTMVSSAQDLLAALGFDPGPADGIAGPRTAAAVRSFQAAAGLEADGEVSDLLIAQLLAARELQLDETAPETPLATSGEEIDEEEIARALERTLIEEGGMVLPPFVLQVSPGFSYTHQSSDELRIIQVGNVPTVTQQEVRRDTGVASLGLRLGLPWDSQADVEFPYVVAQEKVVTAQTIEESRSSHGLGDIEIGLSKQWWHEGEWLPNVLTSVRWKSDSGSTNFETTEDDLSTGTGNQALQGSITLTKSRDPLVFFGSIGYTHNFSHEVSGIEVDPGNGVDVSFGAILAASPDTSLRIAQRQSFIGETAFDGDDFPGSDEVQATFEVGASSILLDNALFDLALGIGLTEATPDYQVEASLPIRF